MAISLADPKPPLHYWLMASVLNWTIDPLVAARWISVLSGVLGIPLAMLIGNECGFLIRVPETTTGQAVTPTGRTLGLMAALLMVFCPFLSFYQRLATADALFVCESLAIVWLSLRWGRLATGRANGSGPLAIWGAAVALGIAIGIGLMTRQGISYTLCAMPVVAWLLHATTGCGETTPPSDTLGPRRPKVVLRSFLQLCLAAVIAGAIWSPYLFAEVSERALEVKREAGAQTQPQLVTGDWVKEIKRRIFYQESFTEGGSTASIAKRNFRLAFIPGSNPRGAFDSGWLFLYLTPPVYLACLAGVIYIPIRRQWRLALLLAVWLAVTLGPPLVLGNVIYSRYLLAGVPPLLLAAAYLLCELIGFLFLRFDQKIAVAWWGTIVLFALMILLPMWEIGRQARQWWNQTLTAQDNYQYVSGWPAGSATREAIIHLADLATVGPVIVITNNGWGTPADAVWVYMSRMRNVTLYYSDHAEVLTPGSQPGTYSLRRDKWLFPPYQDVRFPPQVPVLYVTGNLIENGPAEEFLRQHNANLGAPLTFKGVSNPKTGLDDPEGEVLVFQLPTPEVNKPARPRR